MGGVDEGIDRGLRGVRAAVEGLVARLGLTEGVVPEPLQRLDGALRGESLALRTRRFGDPRWMLTSAEIVAVDEVLVAVTAIGMPVGAPTPILGVDLVALQGALSLVAVDLAPTDEAVWTTDAAPLLEQLHRGTQGLVVARRWPAFAAEVFSPRALLAGARRGGEVGTLTAVAAFVTFGARCSVFAPTRSASPAQISAADQRRRAWCLAERRNRREHDALARMFGEQQAAAYIDFLFPGE